MLDRFNPAFLLSEANLGPAVGCSQPFGGSSWLITPSERLFVRVCRHSPFQTVHHLSEELYQIVVEIMKVGRGIQKTLFPACLRAFPRTEVRQTLRGVEGKPILQQDVFCAIVCNSKQSSTFSEVNKDLNRTFADRCRRVVSMRSNTS